MRMRVAIAHDGRFCLSGVYQYRRERELTPTSARSAGALYIERRGVTSPSNSACSRSPAVREPNVVASVSIA